MNIKLSISLLLCTAMLFLSGCSSDTDSSESTPDTTSSVIESTEATTASPATESTTTPTTPLVTEPVTTTDDTTVNEPIVENDTSLLQLRESMTAENMMAVVYFGYAEFLYDIDTYAFIAERAPSVCEKYPFIVNIPEERVIGEHFGELFCIIPRDEGSTVAINRLQLDENGNLDYGEVIYRNEIGDPVLLYCNNGAFESDTQVNITDSQGNVFTWYPSTDDKHGIAPVYDDNYNEIICDLTSYNDLLQNSYNRMMNEGWTPPTADQLISTSWEAADLTSDGRVVEYFLDIHEDTLTVQWNDGIDADNHEYPNAQWELTNENGISLLKIDFREFAGELTYALLISDDSTAMYTYIDFTGDSINARWERTDRYLNRTYG